MKRYVIGLVLLVTQNICAMELSLVDDAKCLYVAKYLHKYPQGQNDNEKKKIDRFFKSKRRAVLSQRVLHYQHEINNYQLSRFMCVYTHLPLTELKKLIFTKMCDIDKQTFVNKMIEDFDSSEMTRSRIERGKKFKNDYRVLISNDLFKLLEKAETDPWHEPLIIDLYDYAEEAKVLCSQIYLTTKINNFIAKQQNYMTCCLGEDHDKAMRVYLHFSYYWRKWKSVL